MQLHHVEFSRNRSVSAVTGFASNEVNILRLFHQQFTVIGRPYSFCHQRFDREQLPVCNLAHDRQQCGYEINLVREQYTLSVICLDGRNPALTNDRLQVPTFKVGDWIWVWNTAATT